MRAEVECTPRRRPDDPPPRVLILRALKLGDLLVAVPAFRALRAALPRAEIILLGLPWARQFVARFGCYLDCFREFPGWPGLPERPPDVRRIPAFLAEIQAERFDLAVQMHGSGSFVNELVALLGARRCAGFVEPGGWCPDRGCFLEWPDGGLELRRLLRLVEFLGVPPRGEHLEFPLGVADFEDLACLPGCDGLQRSGYVCVHPGASAAQRRWPAAHFAAVARALRRQGWRVVLTGSAGEAPLTDEVRRALGGEALDLAGRTSLGALGALLAGARLLVCNDTGVSHVAAGLGTPSVVVSTGDNPQRWAPPDADRHRVLVSDNSLTPDEVLRRADELLRMFPGPRPAPAAAARTTQEAPCGACAS
jgi:ADP-heptose:LPS heptosyltransferase